MANNSSRLTTRQTYKWGPAVSKIWHHGTEHRLAGNIGQKSLDTLAIPATATECERTFNSAKKLVTPERNCPADDVIEACECLKVVGLRHDQTTLLAWKLVAPMSFTGRVLFECFHAGCSS